jgi:hypothetical protein
MFINDTQSTNERSATNNTRIKSLYWKMNYIRYRPFPRFCK